MPTTTTLSDRIAEFIARPTPYELETDDTCRLVRYRQGGALAYLLGTLESLIEPGGPALTKQNLTAAITGAIEHGTRAEQDELARIARRSAGTAVSC